MEERESFNLEEKINDNLRSHVSNSESIIDQEARMAYNQRKRNYESKSIDELTKEHSNVIMRSKENPSFFDKLNDELYSFAGKIGFPVQKIKAKKHIKFYSLQLDQLNKLKFDLETSLYGTGSNDYGLLQTRMDLKDRLSEVKSIIEKYHFEINSSEDKLSDLNVKKHSSLDKANLIRANLYTNEILRLEREKMDLDARLPLYEEKFISLLNEQKYLEEKSEDLTVYLHSLNSKIGLYTLRFNKLKNSFDQTLGILNYQEMNKLLNQANQDMLNLSNITNDLDEIGFVSRKKLLNDIPSSNISRTYSFVEEDKKKQVLNIKQRKRMSMDEINELYQKAIS